MSIYSIYKAVNKVTNKCYIGFDSSWPKRKKAHLHNHKRYNTKFHNSIKKYGWDNFEWEVIYQSKDREHCLNIMEPYFIEQYNSLNMGYNMTFGGEALMLDRKHSENAKNKMSKSHTGKKPTQEHINNQKIKLNEFYDSNGSRIEKECPICLKLFKTPKHQNHLTCGGSCAATYRNHQRKKLK
jgi:group I intron endonuclease